MHDLIFAFIAAHRDVAYLFVFLILFFEGDAVLFGVAFLAHMRVLSLTVLVPLVLVGTLASDSAWYLVGRRLERLWPWLHGWLQRVAGPLDDHLRRDPDRTLLLARFTYGGVCRATIIRSGSMPIPYLRFLTATLRAVLIWMILVGGLGYAASFGLSWIHHYLRFAEITFMLALVAFFLLEHGIADRIKAKM